MLRQVQPMWPGRPRIAQKREIYVLREGLYGLDYMAASHIPNVIGSGLAVLRAGKIIGTDRCGSVFIGACEYDRQHCVSRVSVRMQVPPDGELVTGAPTGADGAMIDIVAAIEPGSDGRLTVEVAGKPVTVTLTYIGPLPH